jgi:hypothetical protein
METFDFYIDTKVTTWYRTPFSIMANSEVDAKQLAIDFIKNDDHSEYSWEHLDDTIEGMSTRENGGFPTEELYYNSDGNMIWNNGKE